MGFEADVEEIHIFLGKVKRTAKPKRKPENLQHLLLVMAASLFKGEALVHCDP